jgi:hypothetical protein
MKQFHQSNQPETTEPSVQLLKAGDPPPPAYDARILKSDENDVFDEKRLLTLVPPKSRNNAKILINNFDQRGTEFTWNSNGVIFVDQVAVPLSNIYEIFPLLFRASKNHKHIPGFMETVHKITEMGLASYITAKDSSRQSGLGAFDPLSHWWYIGP